MASFGGGETDLALDDKAGDADLGGVVGSSADSVPESENSLVGVRGPTGDVCLTGDLGTRSGLVISSSSELSEITLLDLLAVARTGETFLQANVGAVCINI